MGCTVKKGSEKGAQKWVRRRGVFQKVPRTPPSESTPPCACLRRGSLVGNASLFMNFLFAIFVPLNPPPPNQQNDAIPLDFLSKEPQTELRTLSQNCEQTLQKLRTNRTMIRKLEKAVAVSGSVREFWKKIPGKLLEKNSRSAKCYKF